MPFTASNQADLTNSVAMTENSKAIIGDGGVP